MREDIREVHIDSAGSGAAASFERWWYEKDYLRLEKMIGTDEIPKYIEGGATLEVEDKETGNKQKSRTSLVFFSDQRIILFQGLSIWMRREGRMFEFPLEELQGISATQKGMMRGSISFSTKAQKVTFSNLFGGSKATNIGRVLEEAFRRAYEISKVGREILACPGCGASRIMIVGKIDHCDYCDRPLLVEKEDKPEEQATATTYSVADEIRKAKNMLDEGLMTLEEYERRKKQLLKM